MFNETFLGKCDRDHSWEYWALRRYYSSKSNKRSWCSSLLVYESVIILKFFLFMVALSAVKTSRLLTSTRHFTSSFLLIKIPGAWTVRDGPRALSVDHFHGRDRFDWQQQVKHFIIITYIVFDKPNPNPQSPAEKWTIQFTSCLSLPFQSGGLVGRRLGSAANHARAPQPAWWFRGHQEY